jgi:class 3 adenylate cyclase
LEKLGVLLGHRRRLLRAIANLESTEKGAAAKPAAAAPPAAPVAQDTAERRQVTVMFSDLVQSRSIRRSGQPIRASASRMRAFDRDLIHGGHYGQRSCEPHKQAEHMAAPTSVAT